MPFEPGTRVDGFVSFFDFGATVLNLAGLKVPTTVDGKPFLGPGVSAKEVNSRDEAFGYADRFDEKYDLCRSLRKGRYKYIRNYQSFYPDGLQNNYRYRMLAYKEWRSLFKAGKLNANQRQFFSPRTPEALYDISTDPHEVHNLAGDPKLSKILKDMRERLQDKMRGLPDLSLFPESYMVEHALQDGAAYSKNAARRIADLLSVADLALLPFGEAKAKLVASMNSADPWARYWALIACSCFGESAKSLVPAAEKLLADPERLVQVRAAEFLAILGHGDPRPTILSALNTTNSPVEALLIANTMCYLRDEHDLKFEIDPSRIKVGVQPIMRRLEYFNVRLPRKP